MKMPPYALDKSLAIAEVKKLEKMGVISPLISTHYQLILNSKPVLKLVELLQGGVKVSESDQYLLNEIETTHKTQDRRLQNQDNMLASERLTKISNLTFNVDESLMTGLMPLPIFMELYLINEAMVAKRPFIHVMDELRILSNTVSNVLGSHVDPRLVEELWSATPALISGTCGTALRTQVIDRFIVSEECTRIMENTSISDKVPARMVLPNNNFTFIDVKGSSLNIANEYTNMHTLEGIFIIRDDILPEHSERKEVFAEHIRSDIDTNKPFTALTFYFIGKPHSNAICSDDATTYVTMLIQGDEVSIPSCAAKAFAGTNAEKETIFDFFASEQNLKKDTAITTDLKSKCLMALCRFTCAINLFVLCKSARMEMMSAKPYSKNDIGDITKLNIKKFRTKMNEVDKQSVYRRLSITISPKVSTNSGDGQSNSHTLEPHWRSPHMKLQAYGPGHSLHRPILIDAYFVGAEKDDEVRPGRKLKL